MSMWIFRFAHLGAAALLLALPLAAAAQSAVAIRFAPGTSSAVVDGSVAPGRAVTYSLVAEAGRTLALEEFDGHRCCLGPLELRFAGSERRIRLGGGRSWRGGIPTSGTFSIVVRGAAAGDPVDYHLRVAIFDPAQTGGIERVDFENDTVVIGTTTYRLKSGRFVRGAHDDPELDVGIDALPSFGFIDGYASELGLVSIGVSDGGTGFATDLDLYAMQRGRRVLVAQMQSGDRAEGGFRSARIAGGRLVVEVYATTPGGPVCCPAFVDTVRYRFEGGKLVRDGTPTRRAARADDDA